MSNKTLPLAPLPIRHRPQMDPPPTRSASRTPHSSPRKSLAGSPASGLGDCVPRKPLSSSPSSALGDCVAIGSPHLRSRSSGSFSSRAPHMTRTRSLPLPSPPSVRGPSPISLATPPVFGISNASPRRTPSRRPSDDSFSSFGAGVLDIDQTITEHQELQLAPEPPPDLSQSYHTFPRIGGKRRPPSPLLTNIPGVFVSPAAIPPPTMSPTTSNPPTNDALPYTGSMTSFPSISIPSTPTSLRSRSPSVSSLETIPDIPDAELEAERINRSKQAIWQGSQGDGSGSPTSPFSSELSQEILRRRLSVSSSDNRGMSREKRKRWSVCGAERRGDLDLETIWEEGRSHDV